MTDKESKFIEKLGKIVSDSSRMILVVNDGIEVHSTFFNYADIQKLTYLLQRTSCEWWIYPIDGKMIKLIVRLF